MMPGKLSMMTFIYKFEFWVYYCLRVFMEKVCEKKLQKKKISPKKFLKKNFRKIFLVFKKKMLAIVVSQ
jgi:hypothetical protein